MSLLLIFERGLAWFKGLGKADGSSLVPASFEKQNLAQSLDNVTRGAAFGVSADESIDATANRDAGTITDTKMDTSSDAVAKGSDKPRENTATVSASASLQEASFEQDQEQIMRLGAGDFVSSRIHALSPHSKNRKSNPTTPAQEVIVGLSALQSGDLNLAHQQLGHALRSGEVDRAFLAKVLIGSVGTHLGRAALFADKADDAQRLLEQGLRLGVPGGASRSVDLMMAEAERCARLGKDIEAIQRWQDIASLLGENTPEHVYRQLSEAYARNQQSFGGTAEENRVWGDCHKHDVLEWFHKTLQPKLYLEIGVDEGLSLARATGPSIGVDPRLEPKLKVDLSPHTRILCMSSDAFFRDHAAHMLRPNPGLVFIDGMPLFEFALRDFMNVEKYASPSTLVVIPDVYPTHLAQGSRRRKTSAWSGDIWKLHRVLKEARPDLTLVTLNSFPAGLLLICGLDSGRQSRIDEYQTCVDRCVDDELPPLSVLARNGAIPSLHPVVAELMVTLQEGYQNNWSVTELRDQISSLVVKIRVIEEDCLGRAWALSDSRSLKNYLQHSSVRSAELLKNGNTNRKIMSDRKADEQRCDVELSDCKASVISSERAQDVHINSQPEEGFISESAQRDHEQIGKLKVSVRKYPFPYRAALAISNDTDEMDWHDFEDWHSYVNGTENTSYGQGLGLEVGDSFWIWSENRNFSLRHSSPKSKSEQPSPEFERIKELVDLGILDTLHSFGDWNPNYQLTPSEIHAGLEILDQLGKCPPVYTNHGNGLRLHNLGGAWSTYQQGDNPNSDFYNLPLLLKHGFKFFWTDILYESRNISLHGNPKKNTRDPIVAPKWLTLKSYTKKLDRLNVSLDAETKIPVFPNASADDLQMLESIWNNNILFPMIGLDGSPFYGFKRFRGMDGPNSSNFALQLSEENLDYLERTEAATIIYQHFGLKRAIGRGKGHPSTTSDSSHTLDFNSIWAFRDLSERQKAGKIFVTTTSRLLNYLWVSRNLEYTARQSDGKIHINIEGVRCPLYGLKKINEASLQGICFLIQSSSSEIHVTLCGRYVRTVLERDVYSDNQMAIYVPWTPIAYPVLDELPRKTKSYIYKDNVQSDKLPKYTVAPEQLNIFLSQKYFSILAKFASND